MKHRMMIPQFEGQDTIQDLAECIRRALIQNGARSIRDDKKNGCISFTLSDEDAANYPYALGMFLSQIHPNCKAVMRK